jgi:NAD(P)-dependent dehydrogenase (short-subunit alcohol dehydrogenase family)
MTQTVFITGADRGLGYAITEGLLKRGYTVFAGQNLSDWPQLNDLRSHYPDSLHLIPLEVRSIESAHAAAKAVSNFTDHIDVLINNAGVNSPTSPRPIRESQDYAEMQRLHDINSLGPLRVVEAFLPLMDAGTLKRLCFVSSEAGSIGRAQRTSWFGYTMSKAALNMATRILFNDLRPQGFTFRLYHPGWVRSYISGVKGTLGDMEPEEAAIPAITYFIDTPIDEDTLVMCDWRGEEWPW